MSIRSDKKNGLINHPTKSAKKNVRRWSLSSLFALCPRQRVDYNPFPYSRTGRKSNPVFLSGWECYMVRWSSFYRIRKSCNSITPVGGTETAVELQTRQTDPSFTKALGDLPTSLCKATSCEHRICPRSKQPRCKTTRQTQAAKSYSSSQLLCPH